MYFTLFWDKPTFFFHFPYPFLFVLECARRGNERWPTNPQRIGDERLGVITWIQEEREDEKYLRIKEYKEAGRDNRGAPTPEKTHSQDRQHLERGGGQYEACKELQSIW